MDAGSPPSGTTTPPHRTGRSALPVALSRIRGVEGWLTLEQAARLHRAAMAAPPGAQIVEIGSFRGRSTIMLASGAPDGATVVAIDPHAGNDRGPQEIDGFVAEAADDNRHFNANLSAAGVVDRVRHVRAFSDAAHPDVDGAIDVLYVDGAHRYAPARDDIRTWGGRVVPDGTMLIHDAFSSVGVTLAIVTSLLFSPDWCYRGRSGSLVEYRRTRRTGIDLVAQPLRQLAQLAWFLRNVVIKVLIVAKLGRLTRVLGHRQPTWPY